MEFGNRMFGVNSANAVRFDLRDSGIVGVLESRVGESGVLSTFGHRIGIGSEHLFSSLKRESHKFTSH